MREENYSTIAEVVVVLEEMSDLVETLLVGHNDKDYSASADVWTFRMFFDA